MNTYLKSAVFGLVVFAAATTFIIGSTAGGVRATGTAGSRLNNFGATKLDLWQHMQQQMKQRLAGPRLSSEEKTNPDPAARLRITPAIRMVYDSAPCAGGATGCERMAAPLPGDGQSFRITNYFMGGTFAVYAGSTLPSPGRSFIMVNAQSYFLPAGAATPVLTGVAGNPSRGQAAFTTSDGGSGSLNLATGKITMRK